MPRSSRVYSAYLAMAALSMSTSELNKELDFCWWVNMANCNSLNDVIMRGLLLMIGFSFFFFIENSTWLLERLVALRWGFSTWRVRSGEGRYYPLLHTRRLPRSSTRLQIPEALPKPNYQNIFHLPDSVVLLPATTGKTWRWHVICGVLRSVISLGVIIVWWRMNLAWRK